MDEQQLGPLCSLDDATRRRLYDYVAGTHAPVTRDQVSTDLEIGRATVAYHLDRLVDDGLLTASFARPDGRRGPGAGRPTKHYERAQEEFVVSVPPRDYRLVAELLARAAERDDTGRVREALEDQAGELGYEIATRERHSPDLLDELTRQGFEPFVQDDVVRLRNCPFHQLAQAHTELICGMNLAMLTGLCQAVGTDLTPRLDPAPDRCCVAFAPR